MLYRISFYFFSRGCMMMKSSGQEDLLKALPNMMREQQQQKYTTEKFMCYAYRCGSLVS